MTKEKIQDAVYTHRFVYNFHYHLILGNQVSSPDLRY
jgi:hypothetical protein